MSANTDLQSMNELLKVPLKRIDEILEHHPKPSLRLTDFLSIYDSALTTSYLTKAQETGSNMTKADRWHLEEFKNVRDAMIIEFAERGCILAKSQSGSFLNVSQQVKQCLVKQCRHSGGDTISVIKNAKTNLFEISLPSEPEGIFDIEADPTALQFEKQSGFVISSLRSTVASKGGSAVLWSYLRSCQNSFIRLKHKPDGTNRAKLII